MAPKGSSAAEALPEALKPLAEQLAKLSMEAREQVIAVAERSPKLKTVSPAHLRGAFGVVKLGGNAVDDVNALYDG